jgi:hypothetical protein
LPGTTASLDSASHCADLNQLPSKGAKHAQDGRARPGERKPGGRAPLLGLGATEARPLASSNSYRLRQTPSRPGRASFELETVAGVALVLHGAPAMGLSARRTRHRSLRARPRGRRCAPFELGAASGALGSSSQQPARGRPF